MRIQPRKAFIFTGTGQKWRGTYLAAMLAVFLQVLVPVGQVLPSSLFGDDSTENWQPLVICASLGGLIKISATDIPGSEIPDDPYSSVFAEDCAVCQLRSLSGSLLLASFDISYHSLVDVFRNDFDLTSDPAIKTWRTVKSPRAPPVVA